MVAPPDQKKKSNIPYGAPTNAVTPIPAPKYTPQQYAKMPGVGRFNLPGEDYYWNVSQEFINHPLVRQRFAELGMDILRPAVPGPEGEYWLAYPAGEGKTFWQDARRVGRYYHALRNLPPGAQAPDWLDRAQLETAYRELRMRYGENWIAWGKIDEKDPLFQLVSQMKTPPIEAIPEWEKRQLAQAYDATKNLNSGVGLYQPPQQLARVGPWTQYGVDEATWKQLPEWKKVALAIFRTMPGQAAQSAINIGILGAALAGPWGFAGGALAGAGLGVAMYNEQQRAAQIIASGGTYEMPGWFKTMLLLDELYRQSQSAVGLFTQLVYAFQDPEKYGTLDEILKNFPAAWAAGRGIYSAVPAGLEALRTPGQYTQISLTTPQDTIVQLPKGASPPAWALTEMRRMLAKGEMTPDQVVDWYASTFGFSAEVFDLVGGYALDPLDLVGVGASKAIGYTAKATGHPIAAKAFLEQPGEFPDLLTGIRYYAHLARELPQTETARLNPLAKFIAGLDREGRVIDFTKPENSNLVTGFYTKVFGLDAKSRATTVLQNTVDGITNLLTLEKESPERMVTILEGIAHMTPADAVRGAQTSIRITVGGKETEVPIPRWFSSVEAQHVPMAIRDGLPKLKELLDNYNAAALDRKFIHVLASVTDDDPYNVLRTLHAGDAKQVESRLRQFMDDLQARAAAGDEQAKNLLESMKGMPLSAAALKKVADRFYGSSAPAFDVDHFRYQLMVELADHIDDWSAKYFGVKPMNFAQSLIEVNKRIQGLLLLGLNPTYFINNALNNIITLAWDGLLKRMNSRQLQAFLTDFDMSPSRLTTGIGAAEIGEIEMGRVAEMVGGKKVQKGEAIGRRILEASEARGRMRDILRLANSTKKAQLFGLLSQKVERWSSQIAMVNGMLEYWNNAWKEGKGFQRMPDDLRLALDTVQPGLVDKVRKAIERGKSKQQIEKEIFEKLNTQRLDDFLTPKEKSSLQSTYPNVYRDLDEAIANAKSKKEVMDAFARARQEILKEAADAVRERVRGKVKESIERVVGEGTQAVLDMVDQMSMTFAEAWLNHLIRMEQVAQQAIRLTGKERAALWRQAMAEQQAFWSMYRNEEHAAWMGVYQALGAEHASPEMQAFVSAYGDFVDNINYFYTARNEAYERYWARVETIDADTTLSDAERHALRAEAWNEVNQEIGKQYRTMVLVEDEMQGVLDEMFARQYSQQFDGRKQAYDEAMASRNRLRQVRRKTQQAMLLYRDGQISDNILKEWGDLLSDDLKKVILGLNEKNPLYLLDPQRRDQSNRVFYETVYQPLVAELMNERNSVPLSAPGQNPVPPEPGKVGAETLEPAVEVKRNAVLWRIVKERMPDVEQVDENGRPLPGAAKQVVNTVNKYLDTDYTSIDEISPDELNRALDLKYAPNRIDSYNAGRDPLPDANAPEIEQLRYRVNHDSRTGTRKDTAFKERIERLQAKGKRHFVVFFDLRGLSKTNKDFGHGVGDAYIRAVVDKASDLGITLYRMGGDEFSAIFEKKNTAERVMAELDKAISTTLVELKGKYYSGAKIHYGIARTLEEADALAEKAHRAETIVNEAGETVLKYDRATYSLQEVPPPEEPEAPQPLTQAEWTRQRNLTRAARIEMGMYDDRPAGRYSTRDVVYRELLDFFMEKENNPARARDAAASMMAVWDGLAAHWARVHEQSPDDFYRQFIVQYNADDYPLDAPLYQTNSVPPDEIPHYFSDDWSYSKLMRAALAMKSPMQPDDFVKYLKNRGVSEDEIYFSGLDIVVYKAKMKKQKIRPEGIVTFLNDYGVKYNESWNTQIESPLAEWYLAKRMYDKVLSKLDDYKEFEPERYKALKSELDKYPELLDIRYLHKLIADENGELIAMTDYPEFYNNVFYEFFHAEKLPETVYEEYSYQAEGLVNYRELLIQPRYVKTGGNGSTRRYYFIDPDGNYIPLDTVYDNHGLGVTALEAIRQWMSNKRIDYDPKSIQFEYSFDERKRIIARTKVKGYEFQVISDPEFRHEGVNINNPHFDENTLIHVRMQDLNRDGKRVLLIDEVQSDLLQGLEKQSRFAKKIGKPGEVIFDFKDINEKTNIYFSKEDYGWMLELEGEKYRLVLRNLGLPDDGSGLYSTVTKEQIAETAKYAVFDAEYKRVILFDNKFHALSTAEGFRVTDAPFLKTWVDMALRRVIHYAAINNYDAIMITPGIIQVRRYYPSIYGDKVLAARNIKTGEWDVRLYDGNKNVVDVRNVYPPDRYFDPEIVKNLMANKTSVDEQYEYYEYTSPKPDIEFVNNRKLGRYYDEKVLPTLQKYVRRWGIEPEESFLITEGQKIPVPMFPLNNKLNEDVIANRQPLFQKSILGDLPGPWYSSRLVSAVEDLPQEKFTKEQLINYLKKRGVKDAEIYWTGLDGYLDKADGMLSKKDVVEFVRNSRVEVAVIMKQDVPQELDSLEAFRWLTEDVYKMKPDEASRLFQIIMSGDFKELETWNLPTTLIAGAMEALYNNGKQTSVYLNLQPYWKSQLNKKIALLVPVFGRRLWSVWEIKPDGQYVRLVSPEKDLTFGFIDDAYNYLVETTSKQPVNMTPQGDSDVIFEFSDGSKYAIKLESTGYGAVSGQAIGHFYEKAANALHVRISDADDPIRTLILEEIQSDVHQKARKIGGYTGYSPDFAKIGKLIKRAELVDFDYKSIKMEEDFFNRTYRFNAIFEIDGERVVSDITMVLTRIVTAESYYKVRYYIGRFGYEETLDKTFRKENLDDALEAVINDMKARDYYAYEKYREVGDIPDYLIFSNLNDAIQRLRLRFDSEDFPPYLPFEKTWDEVGFRWVLRNAIDGGYERIELTTGTDQANRYMITTKEASYDQDKNIFTIIPEGQFAEFSIEGLTLEKLRTMLVHNDPDAIINALRKGKVIRQRLKIDFTGGGLKKYYDTTLVNKINGILKKFGTQVVEENGRRFVYITDGMLRAYGESPPPLFHSGRIKGMIDWMDDGRAIITAFKNSADISTFIHETGHMLLTMLPDDDLRVVEAWLKEQTGIDQFELGWQQGTKKYREQKELFARAFERYLMEGKAPKPELRSVFRRIADMLLEIYRKIKNLDVELNDEMRALFDKWLSDYEADESRLHMPESEFQMDYAQNRASTETPEAVGAKVTPAAVEQVEEEIPDTSPPPEKPQSVNAVEAPLGTVQGLQDSPMVEAVAEGTDMEVMHALDNGLGRALENFQPPESGGARLPEEVENELRRYLGSVYSDLADARMGAIRWGETRRDFALLNYGKRRGFDNAMSAIFPYQFWYTRTMLNWLLRLANKPTILANYARLMRMAMRREEKDGFPQRLKGKIPIPIPFMPDWMGGYGYVDPYRQALPFLQIASPFIDIAAERNMLIRKAESVLREMRDNEEISDTQLQEALTTRNTSLWRQAYAQAQNELDTEYRNPVDVMFSIYGPSLPISIGYQLMMGTPERISQLPITRTIQNTTAALGIGGPRGVNIERIIRNATGLPEVDRWEDYRVDRELSNMVADGLIDADTAIRAMIDRQGPAFEEAQRRVSQSGIVRQLGAGVALDIFPEGEGEMRAMRNELTKAYEAQAQGDENALQKFWDAYPEYDARRMAMKNPEDRLRAFLISSIWERYLDLDKAQKRLFREAAGEQFNELFLDKKTRSYGSIETDTLALWANTLGEPPLAKTHTAELDVDWLPPEISKKVRQYYEERDRLFPNPEENLDEYTRWQNKKLAENPAIIPYVIGEENKLYGLPQEIQAYVYAYRAQRDELFPNIFEIQNRYFELPPSQRRAFRQAHPELQKYWEFQREFAAAYPKAAPYILTEDSLARSILGESGAMPSSSGKYGEAPARPYLTTREVRMFSRGLIMQLYALRYRNEKLLPGAQAELEMVWEQLGKPFGSVDEWLANAVMPTLER